MRKPIPPDETQPIEARPPEPLQPQLFNPDLQVIEYLAGNATLQLAFDGALQSFWVTQKQMAEMFNLDVSVISRHVQAFRRARGADVKAAIAQHAITASDGKRYEVEHYSHHVVMFVGYRAKATAQTVAFQRFVERMVADALETNSRRAMQRAQLARAQDVTAYLLAGRSQSWAETRIDTRDTFKALMGQVQAVATSKRAFGAVAEQEYKTLLGATAKELKAILGTKNIRDRLPELTLSYVQLAEKTLTALLAARTDRMNVRQMQDAARAVCEPLARLLEDVCQVMGVDRVTGAPAIPVVEEDVP